MMLSTEDRRHLVEPTHQELSIRRQCELIGLPRSSYYYKPAQESEKNLILMRSIDELYLRYPFLGSRRMAVLLSREKNSPINRKRIQRLMRKMGIEAIFPGPKTSIAHPDHRIYPYLLRNVAIESVNHVWSTDITYIPMRRGFLYLVAVIDWYSRYILSWELSNSMDVSFCLSALERALRQGRPQIFNTDQGSQFTSPRFTGLLIEHDVTISMDGRGRAIDNIWIERFWRSLKYEEIYLHDYESVPKAIGAISRYMQFYNTERPHQSLGDRTPAELFLQARWTDETPPIN